MRPSLLLLLFGAIPFLSIHWDHEKGGGALGDTKEEAKGLNRWRRGMSVGEEVQESPGKMSEKENVQEAKGTKTDRTNEPRVGEEKRKIGKIKKKNRENHLIRGLQKITGVANKTNDNLMKKNQTRIFPMQSFTNVPSASKFRTIVRWS